VPEIAGAPVLAGVAGGAGPERRLKAGAIVWVLLSAAWAR